MTYEIDIAGLKRELPICKVTDDLYIGAFVIFGDVELTVHCAAELLKRAPEYDYIITPEAKAIPLAYEMARQSGSNRYFVARKKAKTYMTGIHQVTVKSITTYDPQTLIIDSADAEFINTSADGLKVCRIGTYTGTFVEQGKDTECKDVPAIVVRNTSDRMIEKAVLVRGSRTFVVTYLPQGGVCLVQEQSGQPERSTDQLFDLVFREPVQFVENGTENQNCVRVETEKNLITIENISGEDIPGSVNVWYKTKQNGLYIGGVSYKAAVDHGVLKADSTATVQTAHFDPAYSELILVTFAE